MELEMLLHEIYWIAGLFEGEACFDIQRNKERTTVNKQARIRLKMTDADVVAKAMDIIGLGTITWSSGPGRKNDYCLTIKGKNALSVMKELEPYMGTRRMLKIREIIDEFTVTFSANELELLAELESAE